MRDRAGVRMAETLMTKAKDNIRSAVLGADRPFRVIDGGGKSPPPDAGGSDNPCPITPLGDFDGVYHFLDSAGQKRQLSSRQLGNRHEVRGLFRGDEAWLRAEFPDRKDVEGEGGSKTTRVVGFTPCSGSSVVIRSPVC